jgi:DNA-binding MarR family transcriptional regulator
VQQPRSSHDSRARTFRAIEKLRAMRAFERQHLPCIATIQDLDLLCEIGYHQGRRQPLTLKRLLLAGIGSVPTVQRRLRRLHESDCIQRTRCERDRRNMELRLSARILKVFERYAELVAG